MNLQDVAQKLINELNEQGDSYKYRVQGVALLYGRLVELQKQNGTESGIAESSEPSGSPSEETETSS